MEAFTNPSTPAKMSNESAALMSNETKKKLLGLRRTRQNVSELLDEIEISFRLDLKKFLLFVENLQKENIGNTLVQELCAKLKSTRSECVYVHQ